MAEHAGTSMPLVTILGPPGSSLSYAIRDFLYRSDVPFEWVQLATDAQTFDTTSRLDDYLVAYASRLVAIKDKNFDLVAVCKDMLAELDGEISALARNRDRNSPPRIVDVRQADPWGRRMGRVRRHW